MARRLFLAYFIFTSCQAVGQSPTYRLKGQEVIWKTTITEHPDDILWKHNGNKVVEFNGREQQEFGQHVNRITLDWLSGDLTISDLSYKDSGIYHLEVYKEHKGMRDFYYKLEVIDQVAKPTISCQMDDGSDSKNSGTLVCSAELRRPESLMKYEWSSRGRFLVNSTQPDLQLTISLGETHDDEVYSCTVSNPLSSQTATFTAKDCYSNESSPVALIAALVTIFIILLVLGLVLFCKLNRKACFAHDLEKPCDRAEESEQSSLPLLGRAPTLPSTQPLVQAEYEDQQQDVKPPPGHVKNLRDKFETPVKSMRETNKDKHENNTPLRPTPRRKSSSPQEQNNLARSDKGEADADQPEESAEKDPADVFEVESSAAPEQPETKDKHENITPPPPSSRSESPSPQEQNNLARSDKGDADADQPEESAEKKEEEHPADVSEVESSTAPEQPELEKESDEDKEPVSPPANGSPPAVKPRTQVTHSSANTSPEDTAEERTEEANSDQVNGETFRDYSIEAEPSSTSPERKGSETSPHEQNKDKDKMDRSASAVQSDNEGDDEPKDKEDLYSSDSEQLPSPSPAKPDNSAIQESADTAHADPDQEEKGKIRHESGEGEGETVEAENFSPKLEKSGQ